jgi:hypothetical protein
MQRNESRSRERIGMTLLPREHGAYGQLAFPLVTAVLVGQVNTVSLAWIAAVVAGFLAHEPLLILLGRRGARARRERGRHAVVVLALTSAASVGGALVAVAASPSVRWSFALPAFPAAIAAAAAIRGGEKDWPAQVAVAMTFSLAAVPLAMIGGVTGRTALTIALAFALIFVTGTLAVRSVVLRVRGGGNPGAARLTRHAVYVVVVAGTAGLSAAILREWLPWLILASVAPPLVCATFVAARPPHATRLRTIGWSLVATTAVAATLLVVLGRASG